MRRSHGWSGWTLFVPLALLFVPLAFSGAAFGEEAVKVAAAFTEDVPVENVPAEEAPTSSAIRAAIARALPLIEKGAAGTADQRTCFTCHGQAAPVLALVEAKKRGFTVDEAHLLRQLRHTRDHLQRGRDDYLAGRGQGGKVLTAGYALWTLEAGGAAPDETTAAVARFLLTYQKDARRWSHPGSRPPSSGSDFTASYVALRGLAAFGPSEAQAEIAARRDVVGRWLVETPPQDTEDRVFRLRALRYVAGADKARAEAAAELWAAQRADGGWSQNARMTSDAYATGTTLAALLEDAPPDKASSKDALLEDAPPISAEARQRAIGRATRFLLNNQLADGSWRVTTRAKPFQAYFESGYPHDKDQFLSLHAASFATLALTLTLPENAFPGSTRPESSADEEPPAPR